MAENNLDEGWKVVTSKKRKPNIASSGQGVARNDAPDSSPKASASATSDLKSPTSTASAFKRRASRSKAKSKRHDSSSQNKPKSQDTGASELLPTSESKSPTKRSSIAAQESTFQPGIETPDLQQQILAAASQGRISPAKSHYSSESASYVTAQQSQASEISSSSSESYYSADEGEVSLDPSLHFPKPSLWTPTPRSESSPLISKASMWVNPSSSHEVSPTAPKPSLWQRSKSKDSLAISRTSLWIGTQDSDPKGRMISQVQESANETEQQEITLSKENKSELRTTNPTTSKVSASNKEGNKGIQASSEENEIAKLKEVSSQSGSENIIPHSGARLTILSPTPSPGSFSPISIEIPDVSDNLHQRVAIDQREHVPEESHVLSHREEAIVEENANLVVEGILDVVINDDAESLGNTTGKITASSTRATTNIHEESDPSSTTHHDFRPISASSTSVDLQSTPRPSTVIASESATPSSSTHHDSRRDSTPSKPSTATTTTHEGPERASFFKYHEEVASTSKMSSGSGNTESGSSGVQPGKGDDETLPKLKLAQLASIPDQANTSPIRPSLPSLSPIGDEFADFHGGTIPAESLSPSGADSLTREKAAAVQPRLNTNEQELTGFDVVAATSSSSPSRARAPTSQPPPPPPSPSRRSFGQPRRTHAIPIRAPFPAPGFARLPPIVQEYDHGLRGVPSHYIPMQGVLHGMFFDPATNMFVGDGPPRATPERADGSLPGTTMAQVAAEPISNRPVNPDDVLNVQTEAQIASISAAGARAAAATTIRRPVGVAPTSAPTRAFKRYFCRCTGQWLDQPHACPEPPPTQLPSGAPIIPGTVLGPEWMTHRLDVDASIYPRGAVPAPGSAAAMGTSAVGGGLEEMPEHWFGPVPAGTTVGGEPTVVGETSAVAGGASAADEGLAEGEAKKNKKKKRSGRRKKHGGLR